MTLPLVSACDFHCGGMEKPQKLYHGTVEEIWKPGSCGYLFVTRDLEHAKRHALDKALSMAAEEGRRFTAKVLEIPFAALNGLKKFPDDDLGNNPYRTWSESFRDIGSFSVMGHNCSEMEPVWKETVG